MVLVFSCFQRPFRRNDYPLDRPASNHSITFSLSHRIPQQMPCVPARLLGGIKLSVRQLDYNIDENES